MGLDYSSIVKMFLPFDLGNLLWRSKNAFKDIKSIYPLFFPNSHLFRTALFRQIKGSTASPYREPQPVRINRHVKKEIYYESKVLNEYIHSLLQSNLKSSFEREFKSSHETVINSRIEDVKRTRILVPKGWLIHGSIESKTQGPQILFLEKGLKGIGIQTEIEDYQDFNPDKTPLESEGDIEIIFVWATSVCNPETQSGQRLADWRRTSPGKKLVVGIVVKEPGIKCLQSARSWQGICDSLVFYEESSEFVKELSRISPVIHSQLIQDTQDLNFSNEMSSQGVMFSGEIKYNRLNWLLTLKFLSSKLGINAQIRPMVNSFAALNQRFGYRDNLKMTEIRKEVCASFAMAHRGPGENAFLIGSFWDAYRHTQVPIVQMEGGTDEISSYLVQWLDYLPVCDSKGLATVLAFIKNHPDTIERLRWRILDRNKTDFSAESVQHRLIQNILDRARQ